MKFHALFALAGAFALSALFARPAVAQYTLTDLGSDFTPLALNNQGQVLGYTSYVTGGYVKLYLVTNGSRHFIADGYAYLLNDAGQVAGEDDAQNVFLYDNGVKQILGSGAHIYGLSDNGYVCWTSGDTYMNGVYIPPHSYLYRNGVTQDLGAYKVASVNNKGQVVGVGPGSFGQNSVYLYDNGTWNLIYEDPVYCYCDTPHYRSSTPVFINNLGDVFITTSSLYTAYNQQTSPGGLVRYSTVSHSVTASLYMSGVGGTGGCEALSFNQRSDCCGYFKPDFYISWSFPFVLANGHYTQFLYPPTHPVDHGHGPGGAILSINNRRQAVGSEALDTYNYGGLLYTEFLFDANTNVMTDLNTIFTPLGLPNAGAEFINDAGQMIVASQYAFHFYLATPTGKVTGVVQLEGIATNAPAQTLTFQFRDTTDYPLFTKTADIGPDGNFTLNGIADGTYHVWIKGPKNLAKVTTVTVANAGTGSLNVFLPGGDADNNNTVDLSDFEALLNAYGSNVSNPTSGYDPNADFNSDGTVDLADFSILVNNFGRMGDL